MIAAGGIADQAGHVADQEDDAVAQVLEMFHLAQQHGVAQVQIGRGGIEAGLHAQGTAGLGGALQAFPQILLANDFGEAFAEILHLFVESHFSPLDREWATVRASAV